MLADFFLFYPLLSSRNDHITSIHTYKLNIIIFTNSFLTFNNTIPYEHTQTDKKIHTTLLLICDGHIIERDNESEECHGCR